MKDKVRISWLVVAAVLLTTGMAAAKTVLWYHFNEGANGTKPSSGGTEVFENAADPGHLMGKAYAMNANSTNKNTDASFRPAYTNDSPDCDFWRAGTIPRPARAARTSVACT